MIEIVDLILDNSRRVCLVNAVWFISGNMNVANKKTKDELTLYNFLLFCFLFDNTSCASFFQSKCGRIFSIYITNIYGTFINTYTFIYQ